ncbi:selenide, water dikinase SelD [Alteromonas sp. CYL-A6]|uniref:selenide, water dikinase SelD n=1 Tax=Alteromonas nitratireducens TaxID=3390813 RepID=UPI0034C1DADE
MSSSTVRLTQFSHGAGCGCKLSPAVLADILKTSEQMPFPPELLVGNASGDDAAAYDMGDGNVILSTTDFFMPIVDDPFDFGRIAATNAISDIYAMGGRPLMAIAILGWPINTLPADIAAQVLNGARETCRQAGIPLAGGHSIDSAEPIFGLAVTGQVEKARLKQNDKAREGDILLLSKPLGVGVLTTAEKQGKLKSEHVSIAPALMCQLNHIGEKLSALSGVSAMTDVTGFGLLGHLIEMAEGSQLCARLSLAGVPVAEGVSEYIAQGCVPGGTQRNFAAYGHKVAGLSAQDVPLLCDPQTSGGLLVAVEPTALDDALAVAAAHGVTLYVVGNLRAQTDDVRVVIND